MRVRVNVAALHPAYLSAVRWWSEKQKLDVTDVTAADVAFVSNRANI